MTNTPISSCETLRSWQNIYHRVQVKILREIRWKNVKISMSPRQQTTKIFLSVKEAIRILDFQLKN